MTELACEQAHVIAAHAPGIVFESVDGRVRWISPSATEAFGWPQESLVGTALELLWHPQDRQRARLLGDSAAAGTAGHEELRIVTKDGDVRWVDFNAQPWRSREEAIGCIGILQDITGSVTARLRQQEAEGQLRLIAEHSSDLLYTATVDDRITWVSPSVTRLLGWQPEELLDTVMADLVHPDDRAQAGPVRVFSDGDRAGLDNSRVIVRMRSKDGRYRWMASLEPVEAAGGLIRQVGAVGGYQDVDGLVRSREELQRDARRLRLILDSLPDPHAVLVPSEDASGRVTDFVLENANSIAVDYIGRSRDEIQGMSVTELFPGARATGLFEQLLETYRSGTRLVVEDFRQWSHVKSQGDRRYDIRAVRADGSLSIIWRDITELRNRIEALAGSERQYRLLAENSSDAVVWLRSGIIMWASPSLTQMLGWLPAEWAGRRFDDFVHMDDMADFLPVKQVGQTGDPVVRRFRVRSKGLDYHWVETHARVYLDAVGDPDGVAASFRTVDAEVEAYRELDRRARFDDLTGLLNRKEVLDRVTSMGSHSRRTGFDTAILFCDVDRFKAINDRFGHAVGDQVLKVLAARMGECVRAGDLIARVGGDEMLIVLDGVHGLGDAVEIAEKIRLAASVPIEVADVQVEASVSIGVTITSEGESVDDLIARADEAMYEAKRGGSNRVISILSR